MAGAGVGGLLLLIGLMAGVWVYHNHRPDAAVTTPARSQATTAPRYDGPPIIGYAVTPDGKPVAGAAVYLSTPDAAIYVNAGKKLNLQVEPYRIQLSRSGELKIVGNRPYSNADRALVLQATTDSQGRFELHPTEPPAGIVINAAVGIGVAPAASVASSPKVTVRPWSRIEGTVVVGVQPQADASLRCINFNDVDLFTQANVRVESWADSDKDGRFVIERAFPGATTVSAFWDTTPRPQVVIDRNGKIAETGNHPHPGFWVKRVIDVPATHPAIVQVGGTGRPIAGHIAQPVDGYSYRVGSLSGAPPFDSWNNYYVVINPDGIFGMQDLPAGKYHLHADFGQLGGEMHPVPYKYVSYFATADKEFVIPPIPNGRSDEALDLGALPLTLCPRVEVGGAAADIACNSPQGTPSRLSDHRGKFVLLQLWSGTRQYLERERTQLKAIYDRHGDDPRFALLGVNIDAAPDEPLKAAAAANVRWPQMAPAGPLPAQYMNSGSSFYLIDPEGKLLARDMGAFALYDVIDKALGKPMPHGAAVQVDHVPRGSVDAQTPYGLVPAPNQENAARRGSVSLVDGVRSNSSGPPGRVLDGRMPDNEDSPSQCLEFGESTLEGRFKLDLGKLISIAQINTYSWHKDTRAPQVYKVYGSDGKPSDFNPAPPIGTDPTTCGWTKIAAVDSRPASGPPGGRYAVGISDPVGAIGSYRYLLFVVFPTETTDAWGHTFYDEVNVIEEK